MLSQLETLAQHLDRNRFLLDGYVKPLHEDELNRAPQEGEYSGRQVIAHLAGANRGMTRLMQQMVAGANPRLKANYDNDYYNSRQQEKRAGMSVPELLREFDETHRDLATFMESLREEDLAQRGEHPLVGDATVLQVLETLSAHERTHIQEWGEWAREMVASRQ